MNTSLRTLAWTSLLSINLSLAAQEPTAESTGLPGVVTGFVVRYGGEDVLYRKQKAASIDLRQCDRDDHKPFEASAYWHDR